MPTTDLYRCIVCGHTGVGPGDDCDCCEDNAHCIVCGQPEMDCQCCSCHEQYPCPGDIDDDDEELQGAGDAAKTPWERRGEQVSVSGLSPQYPSWQAAWPRLADMHPQVDPCRSAADFYLLNAIRFAVLNREGCERVAFGESYDLRVIQYEADRYYRVLVRTLDEVFCEYVEMACGGELRHHRAMGGRVVSSTRRTAWAQWKTIREQIGLQALLDMAELFGEFGSGAFGGAKWGHAALLLHDRLSGKITAEQWVDRVFALVHNGGVFLNKLDWAVTNKRGWNLGYLQQSVLPAQARDGWRTLLSVASPPVLALWNDYWLVTNRVRLRNGVRPQLNPYRSHRRRRLCACGTNPAHGHTMSCRFWVQGKLEGCAEKAYVVDEDDFDSYQWDMWSCPPEKLPIGPHGEIRIQAHLAYAVHVWVHSLAVVSHRRYQMSGGEMMTQTIPLKSLVVEMEAWWPVLESQFQWRVQLMTEIDDIVLSTCQGNPQTKEKIQSVILPLGVLLPHLMTDIDWSQVQGGTP